MRELKHFRKLVQKQIKPPSSKDLTFLASSQHTSLYKMKTAVENKITTHTSNKRATNISFSKTVKHAQQSSAQAPPHSNTRRREYAQPQIESESETLGKYDPLITGVAEPIPLGPSHYPEGAFSDNSSRLPMGTMGLSISRIIKLLSNRCLD